MPDNIEINKTNAMQAMGIMTKKNFNRKNITLTSWCGV